jgi:hypothetical protein
VVDVRLALTSIFRLFRRIAKGDYWLHVRLSARPHGTTRLPMDGF